MTTGKPSKLPIKDQRKRQALLVGYLEMERIVEEIIMPEFHKIGSKLIKNDYDVEVVIFDTESELDDQLYVCGAGLRADKGSMKNAIVFTADPQSFKFILQTHNYASRTTEESVDYHRLTPNWFYSKLKLFMESSFRNIDFAMVENTFSDNWDLLQGPFSIKVKNSYGYYNEVSTVETLESAFQFCSVVAEEYCSAEEIIVVDSKGNEIG